MQLSGRYKPAHVCAALLAGAVLGLLLWHDLHRVSVQAEQLTIERAQLAALQRDVAQARRDARKAQEKNSTAGTDGMPAIALLQGIEAAWTEEISLLRMVADLPKRRMHLQILALSNKALFDFVARLKRCFGEQVFIERQADRPHDGDGDGGWTREASLVLSW